MTKEKLILMVIIVCGQVLSATKYVRQGAAGSHSGSDWINAYDSLPAGLVRGDTIFVADGDYPKHTFKDPEVGAKTIVVKKATTIDHGTSTGWTDSYGDGKATWAGISFSNKYYVFDGSTGGGPGAWETGYGFRLMNSLPEYVSYITFGAKGSCISIRHVEVGPDSQRNPGCDCAGYSPAGADSVTFAYCYFHHTADVGFTVLNSSDWTWEFCRFHKLGRIGPKDGVCGPLNQLNHGTGIELTDTTLRATIRYCYFSNISGTGWVGIYSGVVDSLKVYGNIFACLPRDTAGDWGNGVLYNTSSGTTRVANVKIYHNTFVNLKYASILGYTVDTDNNEFKNNLVWNTMGTPGYVGFKRSYNASDEGVIGDGQLQILSRNPFRNEAKEDFSLSYGTLPGEALQAEYSFDMTGRKRSRWCRGAFEYEGLWNVPANHKEPLKNLGIEHK